VGDGMLPVGEDRYLPKPNAFQTPSLRSRAGKREQETARLLTATSVFT
jgi:hypothetical protein